MWLWSGNCAQLPNWDPSKRNHLCQWLNKYWNDLRSFQRTVALVCCFLWKTRGACTVSDVVLFVYNRTPLSELFLIKRSDASNSWHNVLIQVSINLQSFGGHCNLTGSQSFCITKTPREACSTAHAKYLPQHKIQNTLHQCN